MWVFHRFALSFPDVENLLAERGVTVRYETIRQWSLTFGLDYDRRLQSRRGRQGDMRRRCAGPPGLGNLGGSPRWFRTRWISTARNRRDNTFKGLACQIGAIGPRT